MIKQNSSFTIELSLRKAISGKSNEAISDLDELIRENPLLTEAYSARGTLKELTGDHKGAVADYGIILRINNRHNLTNRGVNMHKISKYAASYRK